jgi:hypothetical protein
MGRFRPASRPTAGRSIMPPGAVVNLMNPSNVDTVFIAGRARKSRGNLVGIDVPRVLRLVAEARDGIVQRSGFRGGPLGLTHAAAQAAVPGHGAPRANLTQTRHGALTAVGRSAPSLLG